VWGFDEDAVKALKRMAPKENKNSRIGKEFGILISTGANSAKHTSKFVGIFVICNRLYQD